MDASAYLIKINYFLPALLHSLPLSHLSLLTCCSNRQIPRIAPAHRNRMWNGVVSFLVSCNSAFTLIPPSHPSLSSLPFFTVVVEIRGSWASVEIGSVATPDDKVSYTPLIPYSLPSLPSLPTHPIIDMRLDVDDFRESRAL